MQHSVVGNVPNLKHTKMSGTLPVLKNEIGDFFFARLGTGSSIVTPFVVTYASRYNAYKSSHKKYLGNTLFPRYYISPNCTLNLMRLWYERKKYLESYLKCTSRGIF